MTMSGGPGLRLDDPPPPPPPEDPPMSGPGSGGGPGGGFGPSTDMTSGTSTGTDTGTMSTSGPGPNGPGAPSDSSGPEGPGAMEDQTLSIFLDNSIKDNLTIFVCSNDELVQKVKISGGGGSKGSKGTYKVSQSFSGFALALQGAFDNGVMGYFGAWFWRGFCGGSPDC